MQCEEARPLISGLVDGELDPTREAQIRDHTADCPSCARVLRGEQTVKEAVAGMAMPDVPPLLKRTLEKAAEETVERSTHRGPRIRRIAGSAVAAGLLIGIILAALSVSAPAHAQARHEILSIHQRLDEGTDFCGCCSSWTQAFKAHARNSNFEVPSGLTFRGFIDKKSKALRKPLPAFRANCGDKPITMFVLSNKDVEKLKLQTVELTGGQNCPVWETRERSFVVVCTGRKSQLWVGNMRADELAQLVASR